MLSFEDAKAIAATTLTDPNRWYEKCARGFQKLKVNELKSVLLHLKSKYPLYGHLLSSQGLKVHLCARATSFCSSSVYKNDEGVSGGNNISVRDGNTHHSQHVVLSSHTPSAPSVAASSSQPHSAQYQAPFASYIQNGQHLQLMQMLQASEIPVRFSQASNPTTTTASTSSSSSSSQPPGQATNSVGTLPTNKSSIDQKKVKLENSKERGLTPLEVHQLQQLEAMQFPREAALRALRSAGDVDGAMMLLVSEIEAMDEARKEDEVRVASEMATDVDKYMEKQTRQSQIMDVKVPILGGLFHSDSQSVLVSLKKEADVSFRDVLKHVDDVGLTCEAQLTSAVCDLRKACIRLLELESKAIKWYTTPAKKFMRALSDRLLSTLTRQGALENMSQLKSDSKVCEKWICTVTPCMLKEVEALESALYTIPKDTTSRIPDALVPFIDSHCDENDSDGEIEVVTKKSSPLKRKPENQSHTAQVTMKKITLPSVITID